MGIRQEREWNGDGCVGKQLGLPKCTACAGNTFPWAYRSHPWRVCLQVTLDEIYVFLQFGCRHLWPEDMFLHSSPLCRSLHTAPDPVQLRLQAVLSLHGGTNYPAKPLSKYLQVLGNMGILPLFDTALNLMCELCPNRSR